MRDRKKRGEGREGEERGGKEMRREGRKGEGRGGDERRGEGRRREEKVGFSYGNDIIGGDISFGIGEI